MVKMDTQNFYRRPYQPDSGIANAGEFVLYGCNKSKSA